MVIYVLAAKSGMRRLRGMVAIAVLGALVRI